MAGRPRTRAKQEAAAAARAAFGGVHDNVTPLPSVEAQRLRAHDARSRGHAHARDATPLRPMPVGTRTKELVDEGQSQRARELAEFLEPETSVRIERLSPSWAAGIVEDATMQEGEGVAELIEYIRGEHGGQRYKLSVLSNDGHILFVSKISIPGPPKQAGRQVPRSRWSGDDSDDDARRTNPAPVSNGLSLADITGLVTALAGATRGESSETRRADALERELRAMREELRGAMQQTRTPNAGAAGFGQQLAELTGTMRSLGKFKRALADASLGDEPPPRDRGDDDDETSLLNGAMKGAAKEVLTRALAQKFAPQPTTPATAQPQQQQQRPARAPSRMRRAEPEE